jgi:hypothetical protein
MDAWDKIDNLTLIENGLVHFQFELSRERPSYFRVARDAHLVLYRAMIEALRGSDNWAVTLKRPRDRSFKYQKGNNPWKEIHKVAVPGCRLAWRYSQPEPCQAPPMPTIDAEPEQAKRDEYLVGFYDALAMIQTECFMGQLVHSKIVAVSDADMKTLEWLHEEIRNEYEHFVPKGYMAPWQDLVMAAATCRQLAQMCLFESGNILFHDVPRDRLEQLLQHVGDQLF